jgi:hypothetical protein
MQVFEHFFCMAEFFSVVLVGGARFFCRFSLHMSNIFRTFAVAKVKQRH